MGSYAEFRHFGGGRKGLFLVLRYVFITVAAYLLVFQNPGGQVSVPQALMIVAALASNVALSAVPARSLFSWYVEAPVLIADTLWVSWAIHSTGAMGQEFFLLYFFVLFLAAASNNLAMVIFGAVFISLADVYLSGDAFTITTGRMLRVVFLFTVALFYGEVLGEIRRERQRADRGFAWARELEARVAKRTAALQRLYVDNVIASRVRSERFADLARELRGRLLRLVEQSKPPVAGSGVVAGGEVQAALATVHSSVGDLVHVVGSVTGLAGDAAATAVSDEPLRIDHFVAEMRDRPWAAGADVELAWVAGRDLPVVETDPVRLRLVIAEVVANALRFTTRGSVTVSVRNLAARHEVEFRVEDTGAGIEERDVARLFQPFQRLEESGREIRGRVGVGLAVVSCLIEQLGGELTVRSTPGRGSSFTVRIPHHRAAAAAARGHGEAGEREDADGLAESNDPAASGELADPAARLDAREGPTTH